MIRVRQIKVAVEKNTDQELLKQISKKTKLKETEIISYKISKQSIDARVKNNIYYIYEVDIKINDEEIFLNKNKSVDILKTPDENYCVPKLGNKILKDRPIIVGAGPAGLFCSLILAEKGLKPIIIERGEKIEDRVKTVEDFWTTGKLNPNSNVQFGEGGAGTFSDGKLNTLVSDKFNRGIKVFSTFVECGAPNEIMYLNKPHIGTDLLRKVIINLRNKIISLGGSFYYNSLLTDIIIENNSVKKIVINNEKEINSQVLVLAIGHSSRDTFKMLLDKKLDIKSKPFAVGFRIQHPQKLINEIQYGKKYASIMPPATYKLTYTKDGRGVYSFCMCPGGYVVNASSEDKKLAINGMSNYRRDSKNANSSIVVSVSSKDYGEGVLAGVEFQQKLEEKAYELGKGKIPVQLLKDYFDNKTSTKFGNVEPIFKGDYLFSNLNDLLSRKLNDFIKEGFTNFDKKMKGYLLDDAILAGIESRTSSPITIKRNELGEANIKGIYPCGEGCGYAGGITTAAMDGIKIAEDILAIYNKVE